MKTATFSSFYPDFWIILRLTFELKINPIWLATRDATAHTMMPITSHNVWLICSGWVISVWVIKLNRSGTPTYSIAWPSGMRIPKVAILGLSAAIKSINIFAVCFVVFPSVRVKSCMYLLVKDYLYKVDYVCFASGRSRPDISRVEEPPGFIVGTLYDIL